MTNNFIFAVTPITHEILVGIKTRAVVVLA